MFTKKSSMFVHFNRLLSLWMLNSLLTIGSLYAASEPLESEQLSILKNSLCELKRLKAVWETCSKDEQEKFSQTYYPKILKINANSTKAIKSLNKKLELNFGIYQTNKNLLTSVSKTKIKGGHVTCKEINCLDRSCWAKKCFDDHYCRIIRDSDEPCSCAIGLSPCAFPIIAATAIAQGFLYMVSFPMRAVISIPSCIKEKKNPDINKELSSLIGDLEWYLKQITAQQDYDRLSKEPCEGHASINLTPAVIVSAPMEDELACDLTTTHPIYENKNAQ